MTLKEYIENIDPVTDEVRIHAALLRELVEKAPKELQDRPIRPSLIDLLPVRGLCWSQEEFVALAQYHLEKENPKVTHSPEKLARIAAERAINTIELDTKYNETIAEKIDRVVARAVKSLIQELDETPWQIEI